MPCWFHNKSQKSLDESQLNKKKDFDIYQNYCSVDKFKKDKLIENINKHLENIIKNYKSISSDCKEPNCILSLMKTYKNENSYDCN